jgi:hypothetical protein
MRLLILAISLVLLAGCQTTAERAAQDCKDAGIYPGHPHYQACFSSALSARRQSWDSFMDRSQRTIQNMRPEYYTVGPTGNPVRCTKWGDTITCQ